MTFLFYDIVTSGDSPAYDQIMRFMATRADEKLNVLNTYDFKIKLSEGVVPNIEHIKLSGITPWELERDKTALTQKEAADKIFSLMSEHETISIAYNAMQECREFIRNLFFQNLLNPYIPEWADLCSTWDFIDIVRASFDLRSEDIAWPMLPDNILDLNMYSILEANGLSSLEKTEGANATLELFKLFKNKKYRLMDWAFKMRSKKKALEFLSENTDKAILFVSGQVYGTKGSFTRPVMPLMTDPHNPSSVLALDLADPESIARIIAKDFDYLVKIPVNRSPFLTQIEALNINKASPDMGFDKHKVLQLVRDLTETGYADEIRKNILEREKPEPFKANDVYGTIYDGFFQDKEMQYASLVKGSGERTGFEFISDPRLKEITFRYLAQNHPDQITSEEKSYWTYFVQKRFAVGLSKKSRGIVQLADDLKREKDENLKSKLTAWAREKAGKILEGEAKENALNLLS